METNNLKEYLKCVFDLEVALYKHEKLVGSYRDYRKNHKPKMPELVSPKEPPMPARNFPSQPPEESGLVLTIGACSYIMLCVALIMLLIENIGIAVLLGAIGGIGAYYSETQKKQKIEEYESARKAWQKECDEIKRLHQIEVEKANKAHSNKLEYYRCHDLADYNRQTESQIVEFDKTREILKRSLSELYAKNVVYAKYRNFVAIATIYEYFDSGRCNELEGPNGAYNLYEGELRSNIIICSLSQIIADLNQIKNGQYELYEQINRSNREVSNLLRNINDNQKITAYYAEATALAASADRYIVGMVW